MRHCWPLYPRGKSLARNYNQRIVFSLLVHRSQFIPGNLSPTDRHRFHSNWLRGVASKVLNFNADILCPLHPAVCFKRFLARTRNFSSVCTSLYSTRLTSDGLVLFKRVWSATTRPTWPRLTSHGFILLRRDWKTIRLFYLNATGQCRSYSSSLDFPEDILSRKFKKFVILAEM